MEKWKWKIVRSREFIRENELAPYKFVRVPQYRTRAQQVGKVP